MVGLTPQECKSQTFSSEGLSAATEKAENTIPGIPR